MGGQEPLRGWGPLVLRTECPPPWAWGGGWPGCRQSLHFGGDLVVLPQKQAWNHLYPPCLASSFLEPLRQTQPVLGCVLGTEPGAAQGRLSGCGTRPQGLHLSALGAQPLLHGARLCPGELGFWGVGPIARGGG